MKSRAVCIDRRSYDAAELQRAHPPRLGHPHKQKLYELTGRAPATGTIRYSRWASMTLPEKLPSHHPVVAAEPDVFDYAGDDAGVWHVNFADPQLFVAYGSPLLAQDELQVVEHPILGSVREALLAEGLVAATEEGDRPTPVLVSGVERRCELDTGPDIDRPAGLYGNRFARAPFEEVKSALRVIDPPTRSHLIAMAAPVGGGIYSAPQLQRILVTAFTAFSAAVQESKELWPRVPVDVRTGFWGCGAFGGNRAVMVMLQLLAARLAGVDRIRFYTVTQSGIGDVDSGVAALVNTSRDAETLQIVMERAAAGRYAWGESDGN